MQTKPCGVQKGKMALNPKEATLDKQTMKRKRILDNRVYASEEARIYAIERAREIQTGLDSKYPSFIKSMSQSHVTGGFWLGLPSHFCVKYLPDEDTRFSLIDENFKESTSLFLPNRSGLSAGWRGFSIEHGLVDGDAVVFHLIKQTTFKVYIVRSGDLVSCITETKKTPTLPKKEDQHLKTVKKASSPLESTQKEKNDSSCPSSIPLKYANYERINSDKISFHEDQINNSDSDKSLLNQPNHPSKLKKEMEKKAKGFQSKLDEAFPSFIKLMQHPKDVKSWLELPHSFCKENLPKENTKMILIDDTSNSFKTVFIFSTTGEGLLTLGWQEFCAFHGLIEDDALIFHLVNSTTFKVHILRAKDDFSSTAPNDNKIKSEIEEPTIIGHLSSSDKNYSCDIYMKLEEELKQKTMEVERTTELFHSFKSCKVCMEREMAMLLLPCMHLCLCKNCEPRFNICPICNTGKVSSVQVFLS
ncbi:hypothetical protein ZOSMA_25G00280 [Zostera marina]|uniref:B3 domain-containing protein n=1 Tax=Zostera marina TaxID=29655 RepID=A0A0K9PHG1_ZOSMR|nr:hypothetical protein ZOSMA_25G00280 [Zostera marina]